MNQRQRGDRCCQHKLNSSQIARTPALLCRTKAAPLIQYGGAVGLEVIALGEALVLIELVVHGSVDSNKFCKVRMG